jgi:hypothetical protein
VGVGRLDPWVWPGPHLVQFFLHLLLGILVLRPGLLLAQLQPSTQAAGLSLAGPGDDGDTCCLPGWALGRASGSPSHSGLEKHISQLDAGSGWRERTGRASWSCPGLVAPQCSSPCRPHPPRHTATQVALGEKPPDKPLPLRRAANRDSCPSIISGAAVLVMLPR